MKSGLNKEISEYLESVVQETIELTETLCRIPAPSHHEERRAEFVKDWLVENGAEGVHIDEALNVVYPVNCSDSNDVVVFLAHTDTVFPDTEPMPCVNDGEYIYSPGVGDDTVHVAILMMVARYVAKKGLKSSCGILFVANSCEEGLGNLKGVKQIMTTYGKRVKEVYSLDAVYTHIYNECVGSHRYEITLKTEGGHSFGNFGNRNAIHAMSELICRLYTCKVPKLGDSITTYNVGIVEGGTSVNTIAQQARMMYEYRSDSAECLAIMKKFFEDTVEQMQAENKADISVETIGIRPCSEGVDERRLSEIADRVAAICEKHTGLSCVTDKGSTDCNIPMSMGIPAIAFGCHMGEGCHTREEKILISSIPVGLKIAAEVILGYFD